jgi:hypothetical protein
MKKLIAIFSLVLVFGLVASAAQASSNAWIAGSPALVGEMAVSDVLERKNDSAYCQGIKRFGHSGSFPYEKFVVFDCQTTLDDRLCSSVRYRAVKQSRYGYYTLVKIRDGHCFG